MAETEQNYVSLWNADITLIRRTLIGLLKLQDIMPNSLSSSKRSNEGMIPLSPPLLKVFWNGKGLIKAIILDLTFNHGWIDSI